VSQYEASPRPGARLSRARQRSAASPAELRWSALGRCIPIGVLVLAAAAGLAWHETGSPTARDWLKYALLAALVVGGVFLSGRAVRPSPPALVALSALGGTAILVTISIVYTPVPNLARDEALLTLFYAAVFAVPALMLRTRQDRAYALGAIVAGSAGLAVCGALALVMRSHPETLFYGGRLNFPITYPNAQAAAMLIGYWPALALAARRTTGLWLRAFALAGATATLCGWLLSQSKGGAIGLIVSAAVVFLVSQRRLRLLVPFGITMVLGAIGALPLTAPIRTSTTPALRSAIHHGGAVLLWLTIAGAAAGLVYAFLDRRTDLSPAGRVFAGRLALIGIVVALVGGPAVFFATVEGPGPFLSHQWHAFKRPPAVESSGTHLLTLGSNRYDFWRVALKEFGAHPLVGVGSRGFGPAYLQYGKSHETPARAHSLPLDALSETGLLGFLVLLMIFAPPIAAVARRARGELTAAGALGGAVYFVAHSSVDWIWTVPAVGVLAMLVLSVGAASAAPAEPRAVARRFSLVAAGAVLAVALIAFVPPWLGSRYTQRAARGGAGVQGDITWAKRLDPLAIEPYIVQATWSPNLQAALVPLRQAVELQPRSVAARYLYGINLLKLHKLRAAHEQLFEAHRLSPKDPYVNAVLQLAPYSRPPR
jgi:O-antigen ligase